MEKTTWYLNCSKSNIAPYVILVGDPSRLSLFEENMTGSRIVAHSREFKTLTGTYADVDISVISVGIGAPATAIAMEELWQLSVQAIVPIGYSNGHRQSARGISSFRAGPFAMREPPTVIFHANFLRWRTTSSWKVIVSP